MGAGPFSFLHPPGLYGLPSNGNYIGSYGDLRKHYKNFKLHNEKGPAINSIKSDCKEYWYEGQKLDINSDEELEKCIKLKSLI